ncbi:MAG: hypothetical protein KKC71_07855 [Chloroflexi bacterium]|nr:hypothetical protein [Chloroflexota bacterium]
MVEEDVAFDPIHAEGLLGSFFPFPLWGLCGDDVGYSDIAFSPRFCYTDFSLSSYFNRLQPDAQLNLGCQAA